MSSARKHIESEPMESPSLPSFPIDVNVCRNPACSNFGVSADEIADLRYGYTYKFDKNDIPTLVCKRCRQHGKVYSNQAMLEAFHICLSNSIPYANCPDRNCKNYHYNIFEYSSDSLNGLIRKPYTTNNPYYSQARCLVCKTTFSISPSLKGYVKQRQERLSKLDQFTRMVVNGLGPSQISNINEWSPGTYYDSLETVAAFLTQYNNYHVSTFLKQPYFQDELHVYTDCLVPSIKVHRKDQRVQLLKIIISVISYQGRNLILAYHSLFEETNIEDDDLIDDSMLSIEKQRYVYLKHPFPFIKEKKLPLIGIDGYFIDENYAYMGHFLTLRKLLKRVKKLTFYMDAEKALYSSALMAFSDRIRSKECDVVILKSSKTRRIRESQGISPQYIRTFKQAKKDYKQKYPDQKKKVTITQLRHFLLDKEMLKVNKAIKMNNTKQKKLFEEPLSWVFRKSITRANQEGSVFWVTDMLSNKDKPGLKMLWLTRDKERMNTRAELNLYSNGSLFPSDSVFNALRWRSATATRPRATSDNQRSYVGNSLLPINLINDLKVNVPYWNFFLKHRQKETNKNTVAYVHGMVKQPASLKFIDAMNFKLTFDDAKRISKWLGT